MYTILGQVALFNDEVAKFFGTMRPFVVPASRRLPFLENVPLLDLTDAVGEVAKAIMDSGLLPEKATRDAVHIAVASVHGVDILLT